VLDIENRHRADKRLPTNGRRAVMRAFETASAATSPAAPPTKEIHLKHDLFDPDRRGLLKGSAGVAAAPFLATFGMMAARDAQAQGCTRFTGMVPSPYGAVT